MARVPDGGELEGTTPRRSGRRRRVVPVHRSRRLLLRHRRRAARRRAGRRPHGTPLLLRRARRARRGRGRTCRPGRAGRPQSARRRAPALSALCHHRGTPALNPGSQPDALLVKNNRGSIPFVWIIGIVGAVGIQKKERPELVGPFQVSPEGYHRYYGDSLPQCSVLYDFVTYFLSNLSLFWVSVRTMLP